MDSVNHRYFSDPSGQLVYLTGSHVWSSLQDYGPTDPPPAFDYQAYLDSLVAFGHNFFRLWVWEQAKGNTDYAGDFWYAPLPYLRTGPGVALDGKAKFDLTRWNDAYFQRLRARVAAAGERGIYVAVMLFQGWSVNRKGRSGPNPWHGHPFNRANNVNGIDGDLNGDDDGQEIHTEADPRVLQLEERYVRRVVTSLDDLDNVLYEICNECDTTSTRWQYHMIGFIHRLESGLPKDHPVGMTAEWPVPRNSALDSSAADWIAPSYPFANPPTGDGHKVIVADYDHTCGVCSSIDGVWMAYTRGLNPLFMDPWDASARDMDVHLAESYDPLSPSWRVMRLTLGYTRSLAAQIDFSSLIPRPSLSSTRFCLAQGGDNPGIFVVFQPRHRPFTVDLRHTVGPFSVEWLDPRSGTLYRGAPLRGGAIRRLWAPYLRPAILVLRRRGAAAPDRPR